MTLIFIEKRKENTEDNEHQQQCNHHRRQQPESGPGHEQPGKITAGNGHDAMPEVEYVGNAVNDRQSQRHAGIQGSADSSTDKGIDDFFNDTPRMN